MKNSQIPKWLRNKLNTEGAERISEAVARAEAKTSAEIVPMVVSGSITTGHVSWILFLIALPMIWLAIPHTINNWLTDLGAVIGAVLIAFIFHRFSWVQRILTPNNDEVLSVHRRALLEFHLANLRSTQNGTGVLIFVSMLERRAVVLPDERISAKFTPGTWAETLNTVTSRIKQGKFADGMVEAIDLLGEKLAEKFPPGSESRRASEYVNCEGVRLRGLKYHWDIFPKLETSLVSSSDKNHWACEYKLGFKDLVSA